MKAIKLNYGMSASVGHDYQQVELEFFLGKPEDKISSVWFNITIEPMEARKLAEMLLDQAQLADEASYPN